MTLRNRLLLGLGLVLAALAVSMVVVAATQRGYAIDQLDRQMVASARRASWMTSSAACARRPSG